MNISKSIPVCVPYSSVDTYLATFGWSDFTNYQQIAYKSIPAHGESDGWSFIASPLANDVTPTEIDDMLPTDGTYDLYRFDQTENAEWKNYKANNFSLTNGQGYLYANAEDVNLIFKGNLNEDETKEVELIYDANASFAGWNLVGNPFPVSAYLLDENNEIMPFVKMNDTGDALVSAQPGTAIMPCEGVLVICPNDGQTHSVIFTTNAPTNIGEAQNVPPLSLPIRDLLVNQDADFINNATQNVTLSEGWNWFSPNVEITLEQLQAALVEALPGNTVTIKSKNNGSTTYNGTLWRGQLDSLDVSQMYRISVGATCEITIEGTSINPDERPVTIVNGYNWIGFPHSESMTLTNAFAGFAVSGDMVKSKNNGVATYNGTMWRGNLDTLEPGEGYIYMSNVEEDRTLVFPNITHLYK